MRGAELQHLKIEINDSPGSLMIESKKMVRTAKLRVSFRTTHTKKVLRAPPPNVLAHLGGFV
jgi:hypothetical protein